MSSGVAILNKVEKFLDFFFRYFSDAAVFPFFKIYFFDSFKFKKYPKKKGPNYQVSFSNKNEFQENRKFILDISCPLYSSTGELFGLSKKFLRNT